MRGTLVLGSSAVISHDGRYRYILSREVGPSEARITFIGLNPSTADAVSDDPTIRRCKAFAREWGCGELLVVNIFAFRSTSPAELRRTADPIGPENDMWLDSAVQGASIVVAAWGNDGVLGLRGAAVASRFVGRLSMLGLTKLGQPRHPLYVRGGTALLPMAVAPDTAHQLQRHSP